MQHKNGISIFAIEDDDAIRYTLGMVLESVGYSVSYATNGREALEQLEREGLPDLILLDMLMPVMDGWQFAARLHDRYGNLVPVIVMTAASNSHQRAFEVHAEGCVSKPFSIEHILAEIERVLDAKGLRKAA